MTYGCISFSGACRFLRFSLAADALSSLLFVAFRGCGKWNRQYVVVGFDGCVGGDEDGGEGGGEGGGDGDGKLELLASEEARGAVASEAVAGAATVQSEVTSEETRGGIATAGGGEGGGDGDGKLELLASEEARGAVASEAVAGAATVQSEVTSEETRGGIATAAEPTEALPAPSGPTMHEHLSASRTSPRIEELPKPAGTPVRAQTRHLTLFGRDGRNCR